MLFHKGTGFFNFLPALRDAVLKRLAVLLDQQRNQKQQIFLFPKFIGAFHHQLMERAQIAGDFFIKNHVLGKSGQFPLAGDFLRQIQHDLLGDVEAPIIQRTAVILNTGVVVPWVKQENITLCDGVLLIFAGQDTLSVLHEANHIVFVKMVRKRLHDALETVSLNVQLVIVDHRSHFFFHAVYLLVRPIITAGDCVGL